MQNLPFDHLFCNFIPGEDLSGKLDTLVIEHAELSLPRSAVSRCGCSAKPISHKKTSSHCKPRSPRSTVFGARSCICTFLKRFCRRWTSAISRRSSSAPTLLPPEALPEQRTSWPAASSHSPSCQRQSRAGAAHSESAELSQITLRRRAGD